MIKTDKNQQTKKDTTALRLKPRSVILHEIQDRNMGRQST